MRKRMMGNEFRPVALGNASCHTAKTVDNVNGGPMSGPKLETK